VSFVLYHRSWVLVGGILSFVWVFILSISIKCYVVFCVQGEVLEFSEKEQINCDFQFDLKRLWPTGKKVILSEFKNKILGSYS
jgi:hypothetical protein